MVSDGCGSTIDCGVCGCFNNNFAAFCPTRPCEVATACDANRDCVYEPVTCGGGACLCAGATCTDTEIRDCRDPNALVCPADFCDPSPSMVNGAVVYANTCIEPDGANCDFSNLCAEGVCAGAACAEAQCGLCNLGTWDCAPNTVKATCYDIPLSAASLASTNCNDNSASSTFIFLDHVLGVDAAGSGTRLQPYKTIVAALAAAKSRGAKGVIVRSGLTVTSTLVLENGISIYGGFSGKPTWKSDGGFLNVNPTNVSPGGNMVAVRANDITARTVLYRVHIQAGNATASRASSYGIHATNSGGLVLQEVAIQAGNGAPGTNGSAGAKGGNGGNGGNGSSNRTPGIAGVNSACPTANGAAGGMGGGFGNAGADGGDTPRGLLGGFGGQPGQSGQSGQYSSSFAGGGSGGAGGTWKLTPLYVPFGDGVRGSDGADGFGGAGGGGSGGVGSPVSLPGAGGGGGAAGGCGGKGGMPGITGGGSFGIFALSSTGLQIIDSTVSSNDGGHGGAGGAGGAFGTPGTAGNRAAGIGSTVSGAGGIGTRGGAGGPGGGGAGGASYGIFCDGTIVAPSGSTFSHGSGGAGGASTGAVGTGGPAGDSFNCQ